MIKCDYCTSEQKGDLPDGLLYTKNLKDFSPLFSESGMDIRFDEYDVCYAIWSDHCEEVEKQRLDFKYCPMCGRKLKPAHGRYKYKSYKDSAKKRPSREDFIFEDRVEAEELWDYMKEHLEVYGVLSLADVYTKINIEPKSTDFDYGWSYLPEKARISLSYSGGWNMELPLFNWFSKED